MLRMTEMEKAEAYWAYAISVERTAKRLLDKGVLSPEAIVSIQERLYATIHEKDPYEMGRIPKCQAIIQTYLRSIHQRQYISLTDIAREENSESPSYVIQSWLRSRNTLEFLKIWESKNDPDFDECECEALLEAMKTPSFTVTPKQWIAKTKAIGLVSRQGKGGGTFAHPDIAMDFQMWLKPEVRLELVKWVRESGEMNRQHAIVYQLRVRADAIMNKPQ